MLELASFQIVAKGFSPHYLHLLAPPSHRQEGVDAGAATRVCHDLHSYSER